MAPWTEIDARLVTKEVLPLKGNKPIENGGGKRDYSNEKNCMNSDQLWDIEVQYDLVEMGSAKMTLKKNISKSSDYNRSNSQGMANQQGKKPRLCWSEELHQRFLDALQHLGGPQQATPKQIREIMQDDDLTNDEVKSHLQKHRLRNFTSSFATPPNCSVSARGPFADMSKLSIVESGSPEVSLDLNEPSKEVFIAGGDSVLKEDDQNEKSETHSFKEPHHIEE